MVHNEQNKTVIDKIWPNETKYVQLRQNRTMRQIVPNLKKKKIRRNVYIYFFLPIMTPPPLSLNLILWGFFPHMYQDYKLSRNMKALSLKNVNFRKVRDMLISF